MSFTDRLVLWLHIGFAIFTIGPVTVAISSTPRYVRKRNIAVVQYLYRMTRVFTILSLAVLIAGLFLAQIDKDFSKPWLAASGTLFVVAIVLLVLIMRDQHRAIGALQAAGPEPRPVPAAADGTAGAAGDSGVGGHADAGAGGATAGPGAGAPGTGETPLGSPAAEDAAGHLAAVERGRIASMGGVVSVIWLVILVLMVWNS
jgi:Predicted integral membrane protein (DUF2269)